MSLAQAPADAGHRQPRSAPALALMALVGLLVFAVFVALGSWQLQRRTWKLDLIDRVEARVGATPVAAPSQAQWPHVQADAHEYRHVRIEGRYLPAPETLVQASTDLGSGYWVLAPFELSAGGVVMVNRGFVPPERRATAAHGGTPQGPQELTGLLRMSEGAGIFPRRNDPSAGRWFTRELPAIAQAAGLSHVAPYFVDLDRAQGAPDPAAPVGGLTVIRFHNNHLVYALTWFGLAAMVLGAAWLIARDERAVRQRAYDGTQDDRPTMDPARR